MATSSVSLATGRPIGDPPVEYSGCLAYPEGLSLEDVGGSVASHNKHRENIQNFTGIQLTTCSPMDNKCKTDGKLDDGDSDTTGVPSGVTTSINKPVSILNLLKHDSGDARAYTCMYKFDSSCNTLTPGLV